MTYTSVQSLECAQRVPSRPAPDARTVIATRRGIRLATAFIYPDGIDAALEAQRFEREQLRIPTIIYIDNRPAPCFQRSINF